MAATVRFDEKLKVAMQINVQACKDVMQICSEMMCLKSIVHVSTAYTQCPQRYIEEKFYPPPLDSGEMLVLTKCTSDKLLECITPVLLDKWPNTYTFTKAIAEDVVHQHGSGLPIGMFRPGIGKRKVFFFLQLLSFSLVVRFVNRIRDTQQTFFIELTFFFCVACRSVTKSQTNQFWNLRLSRF